MYRQQQAPVSEGLVPFSPYRAALKALRARALEDCFEDFSASELDRLKHYGTNSDAISLNLAKCKCGKCGQGLCTSCGSQCKCITCGYSHSNSN